MKNPESKDPGTNELNDSDLLSLSDLPENVLDAAETSASETLVEKQNKDKDTVIERQEKPETLSPEEAAEKKFREQYSEQKERQIIEEEIQQRMSDPHFRIAVEFNLSQRLLARPDLSDDERNSLMGYSDFSVKGFLGRISKKDVAVLLADGMDLEDVRNIHKYFWGGFRISNGPKLSENQFNNLIGEKLNEQYEKFARREVEREWETRKKDWIDWHVKKESAERTAREREEVDKELNPEERFELLDELRRKWRIAKKIDNAIKTGKRVRLENGKYLENLDEINGRLSDRIVDIAKELTKENVRGDALALAGCEPSGPKNDEQRQAFREQLTKNVRAIFYEQARRVQKELKKRIVAKKPSEEASIGNVVESVASPEALKTFTADTGFLNFTEPLPEPQESEKPKEKKKEKTKKSKRKKQKG